jgi:hypothetical protein
MRDGQRQGIALPAAMYLVVLLSGLALVSLADAGESHRAALRELNHARALASAELLAADVLADWDVDAVLGLAIGGSSAVTSRSATYGPWPVHARARVTRLGRDLFWVAASAGAGSGTDRAERRIALLVEHGTPVVPEWAIVVEEGGAMETGAGFRFSMEEGACMPRGAPIVAAPDARLSYGGDSIATTRAAVAVAAMLADLLEGSAPGGIAPDAALPGGSVVRLPVVARGDGRRPPIIIAEGDLTLVGGLGEGILLVRGILHMEGDSRFRGLVVASGGLRMTSPVAGVTGTIIIPPVSSAVLLEGLVVASDCATGDAMTALTRPAVVRQRGWVELW